MKSNGKRNRLPEKRARYLCILCEKVVYWKITRWSSTNYNMLAVMLGAYVLTGAIDLLHAKFSFMKCVSVRKRICHRHFADAAMHLVTELIGIGIPFSSYKNGSVSLGTSVYVNQKDMPKLLLDCLNEVVKSFDGSPCVTARDITQFVNESLREYYSGTGWDSIARSLPGIKRNDSEGRTQPEDASQNAADRTGMTHEEGSEITDYGIPLLELAESSHSTSIKVEPGFDAISVEPIPAPDLIRPLPRLAKTDPKLLQYSFIVDGEALLDLFQYCPQCGRKLEADGGVRLVMDGVEPMVQYVCDGCSQEEPIIKSWKAQED